MGWFSTLSTRYAAYKLKRTYKAFRHARNQYQKRSQKIGLVPPRDPAIIKLFGINDGDAGIPVDEESALGSAAYFSGINLIASTISTMQLNEFEKTDTELQIATESVTNYLVSDSPNDSMTDVTFKYLMQTWALSWGNGYAEIDREEGVPIGLEPIHPSQCRPEVPLDGPDKGELIYRIHEPGYEPRVIQPENMLHLMGHTLTGYVGISPIEHARKTLSLTLAAEQFGASFFANGVTASGFITHDMTLSEGAAKRLQNRLQDDHGGPYQANKLILLDEGMKFAQATIPPEDAQFLQTRQFQVLEIARILRTPPHMLYDLTGATFNNVEQLNLQFLTYTLTPWLKRWAAELKRKLTIPRKGIENFFAFDASDLQTQDMNTRFTAYATARNNGWYTLNDILRKEKMPLIKGELGDAHLAPSTMKTLERTDYGESVDFETVSSSVAFLKAMMPLPDELIKEFLDGVMPAATDPFVDSIIKIVKAPGSVPNAIPEATAV